MRIMSIQHQATVSDGQCLVACWPHITSCVCLQLCLEGEGNIPTRAGGISAHSGQLLMLKICGITNSSTMMCVCASVNRVTQFIFPKRLCRYVIKRNLIISIK